MIDMLRILEIAMRKHIRQVSILLPAIWLSVAQSQTSLASEWPQILGPNRDGVAVGQQVRRDWGVEQPAELWQRGVGEGVAGVAVAQGTVILFHRAGNEETVEAMAAETGKPLWKYQWPTDYRSSISSDSGPRCVPLVYDDAVYVHGAAGQLVCLGLADGQLRWLRDTATDFDVREGYFGAGSTPIVAGGLLLLNVGGRDEGGIVAFSLDQGKTVWQIGGEQASYSSPTLAQLGGQQHAVFVTRYNFLAVEPRSGEVKFRVPFGQRGPTVNAATPIVIGSHVFLSASYGIGARWIAVSQDAASIEWSRDDLMSSQYSTCVSRDAVLYGVDGRQDGPPGVLRCFDPVSGEVHWSEDSFGIATLVRADDTLLVMKTDGQLVLVDATPERYRELARWRLTDGTARALPALAEGRYYVRDERILKCFDLQQTGKP